MPAHLEARYIINEVHRAFGRIGACVAPVAAGDKSGAQRKACRASDAYKSRFRSSAALAASRTTKKGKKTIIHFINFFAYFEVKNGIIFAYRWRGESRAVAACLEHA